MKRAAVLSIGLVAACSAFGSTEPGANGSKVSADASADAVAPSDGPVFVGSRTLTFPSAPFTLVSPGGVRRGDVLLSAWVSERGATQHLPSGWLEIGRTEQGAPFNGGITTLLLAYHVLSDTENEDTTYLFDGSGGEIATIAYRYAARSQPFTPVTVSSIQTSGIGGGLAALNVPPFDTRGISVPLYVLAILGSTTFPTIPNLDRAEATSSVAVYRARTASPAAVTVAGPYLELTVDGVAAPTVMVASLAVIVGP